MMLLRRVLLRAPFTRMGKLARAMRAERAAFLSEARAEARL